MTDVVNPLFVPDIEALSFKPAKDNVGGLVPYATTLGAFGSEQFLNVEHFMADPHNATIDHTDEIQACLDAAFGPYGTPHGVGGTPNKAVYIPAGYLVSPRWSLNVTATSNSGGEVVLTLSGVVASQIPPLLTGDMLYVSGVSPGANGSWGVVVGGALATNQVRLVGSTYDGSFTSGTAKPPCLRIRQVDSGWIFGTGKGSCGLFCQSLNAIILCCNGVRNMRIEGMQLAPVAGAWGSIGLDINYAAQAGDAITASEGNTITGCFLIGADLGGVAVSIGWAGPCPRNLFLGNYFSGSTSVPGRAGGEGVQVRNAGSIGNLIVGGNMSNSSVGVHIFRGGCSMSGVGIENYQLGVAPQYDVIIENTVSAATTGALSFEGVRSETGWFMKVGNTCDATISIVGCANPPSSVFFEGAGRVSISGSAAGQASGSGTIIGHGGSMVITGCDFVASPVIDPSSTFTLLSITPAPLATRSGTTYTIVDADGGSKLQFTNGSGCGVTILSVTGGLHLGPGSKIEVQQMTTGQVTFAAGSGVTLRTRGGNPAVNNKLRAQYSVGTLYCDAANTWTLTGDVA